jgi:hypothetical protein
MARLYITPREINFISDITKEIVKDVIGQKIYYYPISETKTKVHDVYGEATQKVFDAPVIIDCLVDSRFQSDTKIDRFGVDQQYKIEVYVQYKDLVEKGINVSIGDFFSFSDIFYEITDNIIMRNIYGLPEYKDGVKLIGTKARDGQFKTLLNGPTDIKHSDDTAVLKKFEQQRGRTENSEGPTGDVHDLVRENVLEPSITGPKQVSEKGALSDNSHHGSSFFDDEDV